MGNVMVLMSVPLEELFEEPGHDISRHRVDDELHTDVNEALR